MLASYIRLYTRDAKRDASVELLRIYACIMVVLAHIQVSYTIGEGQVDNVVLAIKCLIADNVPIFFTILGFYFFINVQDDDRLDLIPSVFLKKLKGFAVRIYIPTIIVTLICSIAWDYIYNNPDHVFHGELLTEYIFKQNPQDMVGQFWYIVEYIKILVFFPFLALICVNKRSYNTIRRIYMIIIFVVIALNDYCYLTQYESFVDISKYIPNTNFLFVFVGYEVYLFYKSERYSNKAKTIIGLLMFIVGFVLRFGLTYVSFSIYGVGNSDHFMVMQCAPSYICSGGLLLLFVQLFKGRKSGILQLLGEMTLYVFMIHGIFLRVFGSQGDLIRQSLNNGNVTGVYSIIYYFLYGGLLIVVSLVLGVAIREIYGLVRYACMRFYKGMNNGREVNGNN